MISKTLALALMHALRHTPEGQAKPLSSSPRDKGLDPLIPAKRECPKIRGAHFGVLTMRILQLRYYISVPCFGRPDCQEV